MKHIFSFKEHDVLGKVFSKYLDPVQQPKEIITVTSDTPAMDCLKLIKFHKVLCLPVMNVHHEDRVVGLVDVMDLVSYVVTLYDRTKGTEKEVNAYFNFDNVFARFLEGKRASDLMIITIDYSGTNFCLPLDETTSMRNLLGALAGPSPRVPIVTKASFFDTQHKKQKLTRFVTRSDIMQFIVTNLDLFGPKLDSTVQAEGFTNKKVRSVPETQPTIDAFRELVSAHVSAVAVVDEKGSLVGNLSARDVRLLIESPEEIVALPVGEFLEKIKNVRSSYVSCSSGESMRNAITMMKGANTHRIWITNDRGVPVGVLSLSDVCRFVNNIHIPHANPEKYEDVKTSPRATSAEMKHLEKVVANALQDSDSVAIPEVTSSELRDWSPSDQKEKTTGGGDILEVKTSNPEPTKPEEQKDVDALPDAKLLVEEADTRTD